MQIKIEELKWLGRNPTREGELLRALRLPAASVDAVENEEIVFVAKAFDSPERGLHLRWTIQCELVV